MRRSCLAAVVCAAALVVALPAVSVTSSQAEQRSPGALTWLALGDSYSAGEGLRNNDIAANPGDMTLASGEFVKAHNCERATGTSTTQPASRTWSVVARDLLADQGKVNFASFTLKACTGAITNEWRKQWEETGSVTSDLVTLSMGGNNIGFRDTVMACAGISIEGGIDAAIGNIAAGLPGAIGVWALNPALGCNTTEDELRHRVDQLTGKDPAAPNTAFNNSQTLPDMYREIAENAVTPGGHVLVLGYPNLLEESGKWTWRLLSGNRCHRIRRADANMFRRVLGYLNEQTALAVLAADGKYNSVHFDWLDVSKVYENDTTGHHGLCTGEPWLNGLTFGVDGPDAGLIGFRIFRSFHPNQLGYNATGQAVADRIAGYDWSTLQTVTRPFPLQPGADAALTMQLQTALTTAGYDLGEPDGKYGAHTTAAVTAFQTDQGLTATGIADEDLYNLAVTVAATAPPCSLQAIQAAGVPLSQGFEWSTNVDCAPGWAIGETYAPGSPATEHFLIRVRGDQWQLATRAFGRVVTNVLATGAPISQNRFADLFGAPGWPGRVSSPEDVAQFLMVGSVTDIGTLPEAWEYVEMWLDKPGFEMWNSWLYDFNGSQPGSGKLKSCVLEATIAYFGGPTWVCEWDQNDGSVWNILIDQALTRASMLTN